MCRHIRFNKKGDKSPNNISTFYHLLLITTALQHALQNNITPALHIVKIIVF